MLSKAKRIMSIHTNGWLIVSLLGAAAVMLPLLYIVSTIFTAPNENWEQIKQYLLIDYIIGSFVLVLFTALFTLLIGVTLAWLVAAYDFPFKRFFRWALILPLAVPPYIAAYTYGNMFSYTGVIQKTLRMFGITPHPALMDMLSMRGAVFIFTMFLYPYVYMLVRTFLEKQCSSYIENARLLGTKPMHIFTKIVLPITRPAVVGGVMLVLFEVLSDYGVVSHFGVQTFSTAIFQTWFGMYDLESAMRLASWLMVGLAGLFTLERWLRRQRSFTSSNRTRPLAATRLTGLSGFAAALYCSVVFALAFAVPIIQLLVWAKWTYEDVLTSVFVQLTYNTIGVAALSTAVIMLLAVIAGNVLRHYRGWFGFGLSKSMTAGYSIPGAIIAIGVLGIFIALDEYMIIWYERLGISGAPAAMSLSIGMLITGYVIRFLAAGYNAIEAGYEKMGNKYTEASRLLGLGRTASFIKAEWPLLRGAVFTGFLLTFVEIVKELPLALLLRPFNFETLAVKTYQYAGDERIQEASIPSLFIIIISLLSVIVIHQAGRKRDS